MAFIDTHELVRLHHVNANKLYESYDYTLQTRQAQMVLT